MKQSFNPLSPEELAKIQKGDVIERMLAFAIPCYLIVQEVTENTIDAGWVFDRKTGLEIDEDIPSTVSYIRRVLNEEQKSFLLAGNKEVPYIDMVALRKKFLGDNDKIAGGPININLESDTETQEEFVTKNQLGKTIIQDKEGNDIGAQG